MPVRFRNRTWQIDRKMTVAKLIKEYGFTLQSVLVVRNGKLVTEDQTVSPEDDIELISTASGG